LKQLQNKKQGPVNQVSTELTNKLPAKALQTSNFFFSYSYFLPHGMMGALLKIIVLRSDAPISLNEMGWAGFLPTFQHRSIPHSL
jgi:hypothetical protein